MATIVAKITLDVTNPQLLWDAALASWRECYPNLAVAEFEEMYGPRADPHVRACAQELLDPNRPHPGLSVQDIGVELC